MQPTTLSSWFAGRRPLLLIGLIVAVFALVACDDGNGDDDLGLNGLNGDANGDTLNGNGDAVDTPAANGDADDNGDDENGNGNGDALGIEMIDIDYSQDQIDAMVDEELTIELDNTGALEHTFTITEIPVEGVDSQYQTDEYDINVLLDPGESGTLSFTPTEAGDYEFWCTIPGHREAGMVGTLTVSE